MSLATKGNKMQQEQEWSQVKTEKPKTRILEIYKNVVTNPNLFLFSPETLPILNMTNKKINKPKSGLLVA